MQTVPDKDSEEEDIKLPLELDALTKKIEAKPEALASSDKEIHEAALAAAKYIFDLALKSESSARPHLTELLESIQPNHAPQTRAQARAAAQSGQGQTAIIAKAITTPTPLAELVINGMDDEQIWEELELKTKNVCATLVDAFDAGESLDARGMRMLDEDEEDGESEDDSLDSEELEELEKKYMEGIEGMDIDSDDISTNASEEEFDDQAFSEEKDVEGIGELRDVSDEDDDKEEEEGEEEEGEREEEEGEGEGEGEEEREEENDEVSYHRRSSASQQGGRSKRHPELDDGFFNLAEFNAETEETEATSVSHGALDGESDEDSDDDVLGLYTSLEDDEGQGKEARYEDFFDPPKKEASGKRKRESPATKLGNSKVHFNDQVKIKTIKANGKGRPLSSVDLYTAEDDDGEDDIEDDLLQDDFGDYDESESDDEHGEVSQDESTGDEGREAVQRLKDDLFADDDEDPKLDLTTHETRMATIRDQIAQLEAENVAEKDWMLKGEATSKSRPINALLEEDLDFETVQKAVPVVTDEVVKDLEDRIKARILENRFDDVIRKRSVDDKPFLPSKIFELQDTKSKESLAQIYENEYIAAQSGGTTDDRDGKLRKEHEEIEKQWESICYKLDALSNAHFTPKQPKVTISTITNASAVSMESALPTAKASSTILAPEEVFAPNASELRSKSEMTPAEKQAARTRERKKKKKQRDLLEKSVDKFAKTKGRKGVKQQKEEALKSIVKSGKGVTVVGKKSQDLKGKRSSKS